MVHKDHIISQLQNTLGKMEVAIGSIAESIVWTDTNEIIQWCNGSFNTLVGKKTILTLGKKMADIIPLKKEGVVARGSGYPFGALLSAEPRIHDVFIFNKDVNQYFLEVTRYLVELPVDEKCYVFVIRDITALKKTERHLQQARDNLEQRVDERTKALKEVTDQYRSILDTAVDAVITIDQQARISAFNPAAEQIFGFSRHEVEGKNVTVLMPSPHLEHHDQYVRNYLNTGIKKIIGIGREASGRRKNGEIFPMDLAVSEVKLEGVVLFTGIIRDISERKKIEAALKKAKKTADAANQAKSDFIAGMSHEIRTPMNAIIGTAELLLETKLTPDQKKYIGIYQHAGENLLHIINDILDLSKIESGRLKLDITAFDLEKLLNKIRDMLLISAEKKGLGLTYKISPDVPVCLKGDVNRLNQILINLIGNAIKFTDQGGILVDVKICKTQENNIGAEKILLCFSVTDTGIGIPEDKKNIIFEKFSQAHAGINRKYGGTGLGLPITKKLVGLMGGKIWLESEPGKGSVFYFDARFRTTEDEIGAIQPTASHTEELDNKEANVGISPLKVLLVDDSDDNRFIFQAYIREVASTIDHSENGENALKKLKEKSYDLVLMDIEMPVMDGVTATRDLRTWERKREKNPVPVIALSAHALKEYENKCMEAGCTAYLSKPVNKSKLLYTIRQIFSSIDDRVNISENDDDEPFHVQVDPEIADLVPGYIENRRKDTTAIALALKIKNFETIMLLAHRMKGSGEGYGFSEISKIGNQMENAAKAKNKNKIKKWLSALNGYLENVTYDNE